MAQVLAVTSKTRKRLRPGDRIPIRLSRRERDLILDDTFLGGEVADRVRVARLEGNSIAVQLSLDDLDELLGYVAAAANHAERPKMQKDLDRLYERLAAIQEAHSDEDA